jgi:radical SAM PhpK family P-methyltransferase
MKNAIKIDCLFIGHNEMDFIDYEQNIRKMGINSGAYRDLNLSFVWYNNRPYTVTEILNLFCQGHNSSKNTFRPVTLGDTFSPSIAYLGSYLHRKGFTFDYVNSFQDNKQELARKLSQENILAIAITTTLYVSALPILEIIDFIKKYNRTAKIILGGPFISTQGRLQQPAELEHLFGTTIGADIYIDSSQGEATLVKVIDCLKNHLPLHPVNNIYYKIDDNRDLVSTPVLVEDNKLSENMVDWNLFSNCTNEFVGIRTAISCPFSCAFCGFPQHAGKYQTVSVERIEEELNRLDKIETVKIVNFIDDTFNVPQERFKKILRMMIKNRYKFKWYSYFRCQYADRETVELMKESGCEGVFLGLESGDDQILKHMNKLTNTRQYYNGIDLLRKAGVVTFGSFILGFPGETHETVQNTVKFIKESGLDFYRCQLWYCEPITPIWKLRENYNLKGKNFQWSHDTMDSKTACDLIDDILLTIDIPAIPQYNFDFNGIWHLVHRGMSVKKVKEFLLSFNNGVKEKLAAPLGKEISFEVIRGLKESCREVSDLDDSLDEEKHVIDIDKYNVSFGF